MSDVINTTLEAQSILFVKDLIIISVVKRVKGDMPGEHLHSHFFAEGQVGLTEVKVQIIDRNYISKPTERETFWAFKLDSVVPQGLSLIGILCNLIYM